MSKWIFVVLSLGMFAVGCTSGSSESPSEVSKKKRSGFPADLSKDLFRKVCNEPCAGPQSLQLLRDGDGQLKRLVYSGDLMLCSHVMTIWYDLDGNSLLALSDKPVSEEVAKTNRQKIKAVEAGLVMAERIDCPQISQ